jgi:ABC-2 type transport system permease protein
MAATVTTTPPEAATPAPQISTTVTRTTFHAGRAALWGLMMRDLTVLRKSMREFIPRTVIQPLLLCFVFLYVFPNIGQGVGGGGGAAGQSAFATILVAGVVGLAINFQGIQAVALPLVQEIGYTKEIEDRVLAPAPVWLVAMAKVLSGAVQGLIAALIVFPIAAVVHTHSIHIHLQFHWLILLTLAPLACVACAAMGMTFGTFFNPRTVPMLFGVVVLPMTFLGGTYYPWTTLARVKVGGFAWLQTVVLVNPLIYITEGFRAALTQSAHMHLYVIYPALLGFTVFFLWLGIRGFRKRVLS